MCYFRDYSKVIWRLIYWFWAPIIWAPRLNIFLEKNEKLYTMFWNLKQMGKTLSFKIKLFFHHIYLSNSVCLYSVQLCSYHIFILKQAGTHPVKLVHERHLHNCFLWSLELNKAKETFQYYKIRMWFVSFVSDFNYILFHLQKW